MAKPYIFWDTSLNSDLWTKAASGPFVLNVSSTATETELQLLKMLLAQVTRPIVYQDEKFGYQQSISFEQQTAQNRGVGIHQKEYLPYGLTFGSPGPDPFGWSIIAWGEQFRLSSLGFQAMFRGWVGSFQEGGLTGEFKIRWRDEDLRAQGDSRGVWTGLMMNVANRNDDRVDHVFDMLHGKRGGDADWNFHGGHLDRVPGGPEATDENFSILNGVQSATVRIVVTGGSPTWTILMQRMDGLSWVDVHSVDVDLRSNMSGDLSNVALLLSLFSATTLNQPATLPTDILEQTIWGTEFELSQFEPWIVDIAEWWERDWDEHWRWLTASTTSFALDLMRPKTDLIHYPLGTPNAPDELRTGDADIGVCMRLNTDTILVATGLSDNRYIDEDVGPAPVPIVVCDVEGYGPSAPFAAYMKVKLLSAGTWGEERNLFSLGDPHVPVPTASENGLSIFWRPTSGTNGKFVLKCFDSVDGSIEIESSEYEAERWSDKELDIGVAWTGVRGQSAGLQNNQMRIVANGITIAQETVSNFYLSKTKKVFVGNDTRMNSASMLFRSMVMFGDPVTDYELNNSFEQPELGFRNESFENAANSERPGEAEYWDWVSVQQIGAWAEFNAYHEELEKWRTATEEFGPGWNDLQNWIDDFDDAESIAMLFNVGSTLYEAIFEMFGLWGKAWPTKTWSGPPWMDSYSFISPSTDTNGVGAGPTGFNGWYDSSFGTNFLPMLTEEFGEAFDTDPLSGLSSATWYPGSGHDGQIKGFALEEPIWVPPDKKDIVIWSDGHGAMEISIVPGEYATVSDLATHLNSLLDVYYAGTGILYFSVWEKDGEKGLQFGNSISDSSPIIASGASLFGIREDNKEGDAREILGLVGYGPEGRRSDVRSMRWMMGDLHGEDSDDIFCFDSWSLLEFTQIFLGGVFTDKLTLDYGMESALFDDGDLSNATCDEKYKLEKWFGASAVWQTGYESGETPGPTGIDAAMFTYDTSISSFEKFYPYDWEEELWT